MSCIAVVALFGIGKCPTKWDVVVELHCFKLVEMGCIAMGSNQFCHTLKYLN